MCFAVIVVKHWIGVLLMQNKRTAVSYESVIKALKRFAIDKDYQKPIF